MRIRALVAGSLLLLPAVADAQRVRLPRIGGRGPARPAPVPENQPPEVARAVAYQRLRVSYETYPLVTYLESASPGSSHFGRTSFGVGSRLDYRVTRLVSATLDVTSSFWGSPTHTRTAELGTRIRPERRDSSRFYPFVDLRGGYVYAMDMSLDGIAVPGPTTSPRWSDGFGFAGGGGFEYVLSRKWSLTSAATMLQSRMTDYRVSGGGPGREGYRMTALRYSIGLRYNPVRTIRTLPNERR